MRRRSRSTVLIVSLGVLTLLAVIAVTFATMAGTERSTARSYTDSLRATMLAHSGIEWAVLNLTQPVAGRELRYFGEDRDPLTAAEDADNDANGNNNGQLDVEDCPLRVARRPSLFVSHPTDVDANGVPLPDLVEVNGKLRGYSLKLPGTYHADGDTAVLRMQDLSGRIYLNGQGPGFKRLFDNLAVIVAINTADLLNGSLGDHIQARSSVQFYISVEELRDELGAARYEALAPFLSAHAWEDPCTMRPDPQAYVGRVPENWLTDPDYKEPRAPINVNTASREVLLAALTGLRGYYIGDNFDGNWNPPGGRENDTIDRYYGLNEDEGNRPKYVAEVTVAAAEHVADEIITQRLTDPFDTHSEFLAFLLELVRPVTTLADGSIFGWWHAYLIWANANPNSLLENKWKLDIPVPHTLVDAFGPPGTPEKLWSQLHWVDKSDLLAYTTEFCYVPTGFYEISSLGRVTEEDSQTMAERELRTIVRAYRTRRLTTQEQFEDQLANPARLESDWVMSLPEEWRESGRQADYDGQLACRPRDDSFEGAEATVVLRALYGRAPNYEAVGYPRLAADQQRIGPLVDGNGDNVPDPPCVCGCDLNQDVGTETPTHFDTTLDSGVSLLQGGPNTDSYDSDPREWNDLLPHGFYSHYGREESQVFYSVENLPLNIFQDNGSGSFGFWFKPDWWYFFTPTPHQIRTNRYYNMMAANQVFFHDPTWTYSGLPMIRGRWVRVYHYGGTMRLRCDWHSFLGTGVAASLGACLNPGFLYFDDGWGGGINKAAVVAYTFSKSYSDPRTTNTPAYPMYNGQWYYIHVRWKNLCEGELILDDTIVPITTQVNYADIATTSRGEKVRRLSEPMHENIFSFGGNIFEDQYANGICDDLRTFSTWTPNPLRPLSRYYSAVQVGFRWELDCTFTEPRVSIRSIRWTEYRPSVNYQGNSLNDSNPRRMRPDLTFEHQTTGAWTPTFRDLNGNSADDGNEESDGREVLLSPLPSLDCAAGESLHLAVLFDDRGQDPFRNTPVVDDVTITYISDRGPEFLQWSYIME